MELAKTIISKFQFDLFCQALYYEPLAWAIAQALPVFDIKFAFTRAVQAITTATAGSSFFPAYSLCVPCVVKPETYCEPCLINPANCLKTGSAAGRNKRLRGTGEG